MKNYIVKFTDGKNLITYASTNQSSIAYDYFDKLSNEYGKANVWIYCRIGQRYIIANKH